MSGWIKLHRQIREHEIYKNPTAMHLWLECLFRAAFEEKVVLLKRQKLTLQPGDFVFGYREMAQVANCSVSTAKFWMDYFETERMIERTTTPKGTICKLINWRQYQDTERSPERQANAERTLSEPNKKDKNEKNEKNDRGEIEKWLRKMDIRNPAAYYDSLRSKSSDEAIAKAWKDAKRGVGIETPADFYSRCLHYA